MPAHGYDFVVVANRLPVDVSLDDDGEPTWTRSPGGLVTALAPVMASTSGAWVGWGGSPNLELEPFDVDGTELIPVTLSEDDIERFYEGFSNDTLWPLYHDVIEPPAYHRLWWDAYQRVNRRFAQATADQAAQGATVWVHDYQLQLVPKMLRELRPDLRIGYFHHIPFPPLELFAQLPWRLQVIEGLLGADLVGFQRAGDAANFVRVVRRLTDLTTRGQMITLSESDGHTGRGRHVRAAAFPISIDSHAFDQLARTEAVRERARQIRRELGDPEYLLLGVDRLDYTKGIRHRIKAYGELLLDGRLSPQSTTLVQVASPSRENVGAYQQLRDDVELLVGRINGDYGQVGHAPVQYLHQSFPMEEMAALYLAADVMLVTALRDGMNLVAKEYVAARSDDRGALVLSEFTGAADELTGAVLVNPHDIDGMKDAITYAVHMDARESRKRMRRLRRRVLGHDVVAWSQDFLAALNAVPVRATRD
ncbi:trehalose-6-phosphate synthase [Cellulomonas sp. zg-ZUI188]|uniref:Trehalose-6-phosphate synthase n=1 Tax=Cellulomonas fengjieae TaxID=2819978 RepID=A0ABS3SGY2_9CELL|nr:trehalose-6-phosphate synthase [Cellulomonas fengjieae]MBO3100746.1 trehalose-6-phosphate synthase [Cellulomonas fengjieae]QVI67767.1 trehalose-6-phosphate synthase [Cellulomonas fengjieae]